MYNEIWIYAAFGAALLWAIVNLCDKILITQLFKSITARMFIDAAVGITTCIPMIPFLGHHDGRTVLLCMGNGLILFLFNYLYYRAIRIANVSATAGYLQIVPAFTAVWGYLFFSETYGAVVYAGIAIVMVGLMLISVEALQPSGTIILPGHNSRAFLAYLFPGAILLSMGYALQKDLLLSTSPLEVYFWGRIACFIVAGIGCVVSGTVRAKVQEGVLEASGRTLLLATLVEWINFAGVLLLIFAFASGPITLVTIVASSQPLFVIIGSALLMVFKTKDSPNNLTNNFSIIGFRVLGVVGMSIGLFLVLKH